MEKVPPFLYEPEKRSLRSIGTLLSRMPLPGDIEAAGPMHCVPALQWKTCVRLAFVEAGSDWRNLNKLNVQDGYLSDYLLMDGPTFIRLGKSTQSRAVYRPEDLQAWLDTNAHHPRQPRKRTQRKPAPHTSPAAPHSKPSRA